MLSLDNSKCLSGFQQSFSRAILDINLFLVLRLLVELGTACGKLFRASVMAITDAGDSDILKIFE